MSSQEYLKDIILKQKSKLSVTYLLFGLEMVGDLLKPLFIGKAVNDLLVGSVRSLLIFLALHFAWMLIGMIRMRYDTRTYSGIYNEIILKSLSERKASSDISKLSAHSTLTRELIDFLEYDLVYILEAIFNIFGSLVLLFFYNVYVVLICLVIMIPISFISRRYGKKMSMLTYHKNNEIEKQVDVISSSDEKEYYRHYKALRKWQVKISDQHAFNFGIMEAFVAALIAISLFIATKDSTQTEVVNQGELIGIYFYIIKFNKGLETIPYILEKYASLKDIVQRISKF